MPEHKHDWSSWVWDPWVFQSCWRRNCMVRGCFANEATDDITVVDQAIVIDHDREWDSPDGNVEYNMPEHRD